MKKLKGLLKAAHFGPTLIVTAISFAFATHYWWEGPAYVIAFGIFTGQLVVGWSNDLYDFDDDLKHQRTKKPLVSGDINPPLWMLSGGALFGMAAHFINVLKDMDQDQDSGIKGLPQQLGKTKSIAAAAALIALGAASLIFI